MSTQIEKHFAELNHALQAMNALRALSKATSIMGIGRKNLQDPGFSSSAASAQDDSQENEAEEQEGGKRRASLWGKAQVGHFARLGISRHADPLVTTPHKCSPDILWALVTNRSSFTAD